jgi:hypothetical protein
MIDKQCFNSKAIAIFKEEKFSNIFHAYDLSSEEKLLKCKVPPFARPYFDNAEEIYLKGYELKDPKSKMTYLLPSGFKNEQGNYVHISTLFPIKIKRSYEVYHGKKVYHWVGSENLTSVAYPQSEDPFLKQDIDTWFDIEHSNPNDMKVCKFMLLASHAGGFSRGIGDKGFGKDGLGNTLIGVTGIGNNISKVKSDAKWIKLIDDKYTLFNEISGFGGERLEIAENFFLGTGDENTPVYNHSTTGTDQTGNSRDITRYSYSIIHNPPSYYMEKGKITFEQMFQPAVFDRFFPLKLEGGVLGKNSFQDPSIDFKEVAHKSMDFYKQFIGDVVWIRNELWKQALLFSIDKYIIGYEGRSETSSRWMNTFIHIAQVVQEYVKYDEHKNLVPMDVRERLFYENLDLVYNSHQRAVAEIKELSLI